LKIIGNYWKRQYKFFKFFLNNGKEKRVQVVAWNDDIDPILHQILPNYVNIFIFLYFNFFPYNYKYQYKESRILYEKSSIK